MGEDDTRTLWCGNLADQVTDELLYELFLQAGPLERVRIARDKEGRLRNFAFITYCHEVSVPYALLLFRGTTLFKKALSLQSRGKTADLPPPIRATTLDPAYEYRMNEKTEYTMHSHNNEKSNNNDHDDLKVASLQGNWSHRPLHYKPYHDEVYERRRNKVISKRNNKVESNWRYNDKKGYSSRHRNNHKTFHASKF